MGPFYDLKYGETRIIDKSTDTSRSATISSAHSFIELPEEYYTIFTAQMQLIDEVECGTKEAFGDLCTTTRECSDLALDMQPISFGLGKDIKLTI